MKKILIEVLEFYKMKLENDKCTPEELRTAFNALSNDVVCEVTIKDLADFYGQSESNVRNVLSRNIIEKPKRKITYNFISVSKILPSRWKKP